MKYGDEVRGARIACRECVEVGMTYQSDSVEGDRRKPRPTTARGFELEDIRTAVQGIRHGEVRLTIQDGFVIQIDRVEKRRLR